jgi:hypothetical protein
MPSKQGFVSSLKQLGELISSKGKAYLSDVIDSAVIILIARILNISWLYFTF